MSLREEVEAWAKAHLSDGVLLAEGVLEDGDDVQLCLRAAGASEHAPRPVLVVARDTDGRTGVQCLGDEEQYAGFNRAAFEVGRRPCAGVCVSA